MCLLVQSPESNARDLSEYKIDALKKALEDKRRTVLLMDVVEQKEKIRIKRFQEIVKMMGDLQ